MTNQVPFTLSDLGRTVRGVFRRSTADESTNFVRFHDEPTYETTEMKPVTNGTAGKIPLEDGLYEDPTECPADSTSDKDSFYGVRDDSKDTDKNKITEWQAGWNVTNAIQGMFTVTFPYAVVEGGYWTVFAMVIAAYICMYTGKILVACLYEEDASGRIVRVRGSYVEIAEEVWGARIGGRVVYTAQMIELLMTCILYVLLCGDLMVGSFPDSPIDLSSWIMICASLLLPCAFLRSLQAVSWLSFGCTVAHMFINAIILLYCLTLVREWHWDAVQFRVDIWTFPISLGIVIFSYTSQIFLPSLEGNMKRPERFHCMMHWSHFAAAIFKALFSYVGFVTWGFQTKEVITNNLPNRGMRIVVNLFLVAKALLSYPLPYFAATDLLETALFRGRPHTLFSGCYDSSNHLYVWALALRLLLVIFTILMAMFIPHFAILMGLVGSLTGNMLSLVFPCYFHLRIKWHYLSWYHKGVDIFIILMGFVLSIIGVYYSFHALVKAFEGFEPRPFQGQTG